MEKIWYAAAAVWGMIIAGWSLLAALFGGRGRAVECIVLPIDGHVEDVEWRIRNAVCHRRSLRQRGMVIYVVDYGVDGETAAIAQKLCGELEMVEWIPADELTTRVGRLSEGMTVK